MDLRNEDGQAQIIALVAGIFIFVGMFFIFKDVFHDESPNAWTPVANFFKSKEEKPQEKTAPIKNFFPPRPPEEPSKVPELPKEPIQSETNWAGKPISAPKTNTGEKSVPTSKTNTGGGQVLSSVTITGEWHGRYTATSPNMFAGKGGGWEAQLYEDSDGKITGQYTSDFGINGKVEGKREGAKAEWKVGEGDSGLKYKGSIKGNTISGTWEGMIFEGQYAKGNFFGGRVVK